MKWLLLFFGLVLVSSVSALEVTYFRCDTPAQLGNGSVVCVECVKGTVFNNVSGSCDLGSSVGRSDVNEFESFAARFFPENPQLGVFIFIGVGAFLAYKLWEGVST